MPKKLTRQRYREMEDRESTPPRYSIQSASGAELVPAVDANPWFPCTIDPETHELRYVDFNDDPIRYLPIEQVPSGVSDYLTPFNVVTQGDRLLIVQEQCSGHPHNDKNRKYGLISVDISSGQRKETGLRYAYAGFGCGERGDYYGLVQLSDNYEVTQHDQITFVGGMGLLNDQLEILIEPRFEDIRLMHLKGIDFAIVAETKANRKQYGLFNIRSRTWVVSCEYDYIDVTSKYFLLIQGWLDYGHEVDLERKPLTRILDFQGQRVTEIAYVTYYHYSYAKSDSDSFLFVKDERWGKVGINGAVQVQPQFLYHYDVPEEDYVLSDIKFTHGVNNPCILAPDDMLVLERLAADAPMAIKYEGTELGPDGQANVTTLAIEGISFLSIDAEFEDFKFVIALQDTDVIDKGTVLIKRTKSKAFSTVASNNAKLYNYLQNILAQADLFSGLSGV